MFSHVQKNKQLKSMNGKKFQTVLKFNDNEFFAFIIFVTNIYNVDSRTQKHYITDKSKHPHR